METRGVKWFVIVNPVAGGGRGLDHFPQISKHLRDAYIRCEPVFTEHKFHATELTVTAVREGYRHIIVVGGDGTLHEVVNGIFYQKEVPVDEVTLAVLPAGSANDWTRMYKIPKDYDRAVDTIIEGRTVRQDIARIEYSQAGVRNSRYMVNVAGIGLDANICYRCNIAKNKGDSGEMAYVKAAFKALLGRTCTPAKVVVDGRSFFSGKMFSVAFGIGKYSGGGMMQVPDAVADDGLVNVMVAAKVSKIKFLLLFKSLFKGIIYKVKEVSHIMAKRVTVITRRPDRVEIDGEVVGTTPMTLEVIPQALRVVVGRDFNR